jgi:hypothetical protein
MGKKTFRAAILFTVGLLAATPLFASPTTSSVAVTGQVVDSATGAPIGGAKVLVTALSQTQMIMLIFSTDPLGSLFNMNLKLDTAYTGADGTYSKSIKVDSTAYLIGGIAIKPGYQVSFSYMKIDNGAAALPPIRLNSRIILDTLAVSGTVVDTATGRGIPGALIVMSGPTGDTVDNWALTDVNGQFTKQVIINNTASFKALVYLVSKQGYQAKVGQGPITAKQVNLGTIKLKMSTQVILSCKQTATGGTANDIRVYSLKGQLLYAGPAVAAESQSRLRHTPVIVEFRANNRSVDRKEIIFSK